VVEKAQPIKAICIKGFSSNPDIIPHSSFGGSVQ